MGGGRGPNMFAHSRSLNGVLSSWSFDVHYLGRHVGRRACSNIAAIRERARVRGSGRTQLEKERRNEQEKNQRGT